MNNDITITLTGDQAYDFIRNQSLDESSISLLQDQAVADKAIINDLNHQVGYLVNELSDLRTAYAALDKKYNESITDEIDYRLARDTNIANAIAKPTLDEIVPITGLNGLTVVSKPKLKSRLHKVDEKALAELAPKNFTSAHRIDKFAKSLNLRPSTVITYIKKHSNGRFTVVKGSDIREGDFGFKFSVAKNAMYFTVNNGTYDSVHTS